MIVTWLRSRKLGPESVITLVLVSVAPAAEARVPPVHCNRPAGKLNVAPASPRVIVPRNRRTAPGPLPVYVPTQVGLAPPVGSRAAFAATLKFPPKLVPPPPRTSVPASTSTTLFWSWLLKAMPTVDELASDFRTMPLL